MPPATSQENPPLPERMRPRDLDEVVGQRHILGPGRPLRSALEAGRVPSMLLWGPPGCGKTTLARLLARRGEATFVPISAVLSGTQQLRAALERAEDAWRLGRKATVIFVDEIHRWNKAQQDALLPHVESGTITLIGATTENPSFSVNRTLLSRMEVVTLRALSQEDLQELLQRALNDTERGLGTHQLRISADALAQLSRAAQGDARHALGLLERVAEGLPDGTELGVPQVLDRLGADTPLLSLDADVHYALASALIKSMRGSDPDAALYWLARSIRAGEDPKFIARRLVIFASEDVGNAEPRALDVALGAARAVELIGLPEGRINLAQAVTFLATAPKSNAAYLGIGRALEAVDRLGPLPVPPHLLPASTALAKQSGAGKGYLYPHDHPYGLVAQQMLPEELGSTTFYEPVAWGHEKVIRERMVFVQEKKSRTRQ